MTQKNWISVGGLLLLALVCLLLVKLISGNSGSDDPSETQSRRDQISAELDRETRDADPLIEPQGGELRYAATLLSEPPQQPEGVQYPKYRAGGSGTRGAIRDRAGNLIRRATVESPVVAITISPNDELIWVSGADVKSYIINKSGEEIANLPIVPPGDNMLGFGKWVWLDNNRLLGQSGVQRFDEQGKPVACCQGHNVSESRFYVYDLKTKAMVEMQLPKDLREKVVSIGKVLKTGELQLGHEGDGFGWFRVAAVAGEEK